jgi:MFS family permease
MMDKNILYLGLTSFFNDVSSEMIFPLLPAFMAEALKIPKSVIGIIDGVAESIASLLKVFSGYLSDRIRKRKSLAVFGYGLSAITKPFLALAQGWFAVFSVRVGDRIGKGIRTAPRDALIAASSQPKNRGRTFGFHRAMDTGGALLGTFTAFVLMRFFNNPYRLIFALSVIPALIGILFISFGAQERKDISQGKLPVLTWNTLPQNLRLLIIGMFIFGVGDYTFTFFLLRVRGMGIAMATVPLVYLVYNIFYSLAAYPVGILSDKIGKKPLLLTGIGLYVILALCFAFFKASLWAWILMAFYGLHMALTDATARALVSDMAAPEIRGAALGLYHTGVGIADLPAGLLAGFLWEKVSYRATFIMGALLASIALMVLGMVKSAE